MTKCKHLIKTKAIQEWEEKLDNISVTRYNRIWYCLQCNTPISTIDYLIDGESPLDSFRISERCDD